MKSKPERAHSECYCLCFVWAFVHVGFLLSQRSTCYFSQQTLRIAIYCHAHVCTHSWGALSLQLAQHRRVVERCSCFCASPRPVRLVSSPSHELSRQSVGHLCIGRVQTAPQVESNCLNCPEDCFHILPIPPCRISAATRTSNKRTHRINHFQYRRSFSTDV